MGPHRLPRALALVASALVVGFVAFAVVSAIERHGLGGDSQGVLRPARLAAGDRAPVFDLARLGGGRRVDFGGSIRGPAIVNFFASTCPNCIAELDAFSTVARAARGTRFVGVDTEDPNPGAAERLLRRAGIAYPVGVDESGSVADRYRVSALPVTFFVARSGKLVGELFGTARAKTLSSWVARLSGRR